jgi:hypothetical protein
VATQDSWVADTCGTSRIAVVHRSQVQTTVQPEAPVLAHRVSAPGTSRRVDGRSIWYIAARYIHQYDAVHRVPCVDARGLQARFKQAMREYFPAQLTGPMCVPAVKSAEGVAVRRVLMFPEVGVRVPALPSTNTASPLQVGSASDSSLQAGCLYKHCSKQSIWDRRVQHPVALPGEAFDPQLMW